MVDICITSAWKVDMITSYDGSERKSGNLELQNTVTLVQHVGTVLLQITECHTATVV